MPELKSVCCSPRWPATARAWLLLCALLGAANPLPLGAEEPRGEGVSILLLPYFERDPRLDEGRELIHGLIIDAFDKRGVSLVPVEQSEHSEEWIEALNAAGGLFDPGRHVVGDDSANLVLDRFRRQIGPEHGYDGFMVPAIVLRPTKVIDSRARWDGVSRLVQKKGKAGKLTAVVNCVSLRLTVLDKTLETRLPEAIGGLVVPVYVDSLRMKFVLKDDIFEETGQVREGVGLAVDLLLKNHAWIGK